MWGALALIFVTITFLVYLLKLNPNKNVGYWSKQGVTFFKNDLGMFEFLTGKKAPVDFDLDNYKQLGDQKFAGLLELGNPTLFVKDLDLVKLIMVKDHDHFVDHRHSLDNDPFFSKSLFFLYGQEWKDMRSFLSPTFTSGKIKRMFTHFERSSEKLIEYIQEKEKVDGGFNVLVPEIIYRFTVDVIGSTAFGIETDTLTNANSQFYKMAQKTSDVTFDRLIRFGILSFFPKFEILFKLLPLNSEVNEFFRSILSQAFRAREGKVEKREDFLQLLIEAKEGRLNDDDTNELNSKNDDTSTTKVTQKTPKLALTEEMAIPQAFAFFLAGFDTVANLLSTAVYMLGVYPEIQKKVYEEVERFMEYSNGKINYESASQMEYLEMVISEILRLYPAAQRLERTCGKSYKIPDTNVIIPKGMVVVVPAEALHYDEKYFPNPFEFDPERFSAENKAQRNPYCYLPFGTGPRNCIGMRFALIQAKVALAYIIHNFIIEPLPGITPIPVKMWKFSGFNRVPNDLKMRMVSRK